jgi:hypothetical protein
VQFAGNSAGTIIVRCENVWISEGNQTLLQHNHCEKASQDLLLQKYYLFELPFGTG